MATAVANPDASTPPSKPHSVESAILVVRFGLRRLFEALTYTAIVAWALSSTTTTYDVYGFAPMATELVGVALGGIVTLLLLPLLQLYHPLQLLLLQMSQLLMLFTMLLLTHLLLLACFL